MMSAVDIMQSPTIVHAPVNLSSPPEGESITLGQFSGCGCLSWRVVDNMLVVNNTSTGECVQLWRPGNHGNISHVTELDLHLVDGPLLVVTVKEKNYCTLAVLSPTTSKLIRAVSIPFLVTVVHPFSLSDTTIHLASSGQQQQQVEAQLFGDTPLACFSGIVALGGNEGMLLLIDLHLSSGNSAPVSMTSPSQLQLLDGPITMEDIQSISESGRHASIQISQGGGGQFVYQQKVLPSLAVKVTSLHFVPQLCCLFVGYSFGGFQIYDVSALVLLYSSSIPQVKPLPAITHFTLIEPDNDPRSFVYVWVARGASDIAVESTKCETKLILYQMVFADKSSPSKTSQVVAYRNFQSCGPRMEYALTPSPSVPNPLSSVGTKLLKCITPLRYHSGYGAEGHELDMSVSVFVWGCGSPGQRDYIIGLFDINQWYHAQMPNVLRWRRSGKHTGVLGCSYFAFFTVKPAIKSTSLEMMDVCICDLIPFILPPPIPESHMWPTAMQFDFKALSSSTVLSCQFQGLPRTSLHELDVCRGVLFNQPERLFNMCTKADLLPAGWEHSVQVIDINFQRQALLDIAVDFGCPYRVMTSLAESWLGSEVTDPMLVDWLSSKMATIVQKKSELCTYVSEGSSSEMLRKSLWCQLSALQHFLEKILSQSPTDDYLAATFNTLSDLYYTTVMHKNLLDALSYFTVGGTDSSSRPFTYPYTTLSMRYEFLRKEQSDTLKLIVDHVYEDLEEVFDQPYPPVSLEALLDVFLTPHIKAQHFMMIYMMCDLVSIGVLSEDLIGEYGRSHGLPCELVAVSRGLWALDNQKYKDKQCEHDMKLLLHNLDRPLFPWQHCAVCSAFLSTNEIDLALLYIRCYGVQMQTTDEIKLRVEILVRGHRLNEACGLLSQHEGSQEFDELFNSFLENCYDAKSLHQILEYPFDGQQEELLVNYLEQHPSLVVKEMAVFYFLLRHDYVEASKVHKQIKPLAKSHPDPRAMQNCLDRELLLAGFYSVIPTPLHQVLEREHHETGSDTITAETNGTLSSVVAKEIHSGELGSRAGLIYDSLQALANKRNKDAEPMTPFKTVREKSGYAPFLSTPVSVRKARAQSHDSMRLLTPAPSRSVAITSGVSATPDNLQMKVFQEHMKSFKEKMSVFNQSKTTNLDVQTPLQMSSPKASNYFSSSLRSVTTPPSILKIKNPGSSVTRTPSSETKKIRFAVEGDQATQVTPFLDRSTRRVPSSYTPIQPSSLTTIAATTTSLAKQTPLPSSDDSDLFQSPLQSPSDLNDATTVSSLSSSTSTGLSLSTSGDTHTGPSLSLSTSGDTHTGPSLSLSTSVDTHTGPSLSLSTSGDTHTGPSLSLSTSGDTHTGPSLSLSTSVDAHKESLEETVAMEIVEQSEERESGELLTKQSETETMSPQVEDTSNKQNEDISVPADEPLTSTRFETTQMTHSVATSTTTSSPAVRELMSQLTRKSISSTISPQVTPLSGRFSTHSIKSTPSSSVVSQLASTSSTTTAASTSTFFSPIPMLDDLIAAKHKKLKRSLEEAKKHNLALITTGSSRVEQQRSTFSTTMVQQMKTKEATVETASTTVKGSQYSFSPPTGVQRVKSESVTAVSSSSPPTVETHPASFVFSPPLTRSAARRLRSSGGGDTSIIVADEKQPEETASTKKRGRGRPRKSVSSTPERSIPESVGLVSPPSHQATPTLIPKEPRHHHKKTRTAKSGVSTRRSTRLLMGKK